MYGFRNEIEGIDIKYAYVYKKLNNITHRIVVLKSDISNISGSHHFPNGAPEVKSHQSQLLYDSNVDLFFFF